jgi:hypothetical protein
MQHCSDAHYAGFQSDVHRTSVKRSEDTVCVPQRKHFRVLQRIMRRFTAIMRRSYDLVAENNDGADRNFVLGKRLFCF